MRGSVVAFCAAAGTYYLYTAVVLGWHGLRPGPPVARRTRRRRRASEWLAQAGIGDVSLRQFVLVTGVLAALGAVAGLAMFGGVVPACGEVGGRHRPQSA